MRFTREQWSWALYDWANSAFATTVMAGFFPVFFREYWSLGADSAETTLRLGWANGAAGLIIALCAPLLGALADRSARRKRFIVAFTLLGALCTAALLLVARGQWPLAAVLFALATLGFNGGVVFYDSLLTAVARPHDYDRVSALGFSLGYLGGGLLFLLNVLMTLYPTAFGLSSTAEAVQWSFVTVALWWLLFSVPLLRVVPEPPRSATDSAGSTPSGRAAGLFVSSWRELLATLRLVAARREVWLFLLAYWLYIDGVNTIIKMAVDFGMQRGLPSADLLTALLVTQFVGFPAALVFGWLGSRIGAKRGILIGLAVYVALTVWSVRLDSTREFFAMAMVVGLVQGGVQALSRSLYGQFVPPEKSAEYFGLYNMMGKFATVLGPPLLGWATVLTGGQSHSNLALLLLFVPGALLLWRVPLPQR